MPLPPGHRWGLAIVLTAALGACRLTESAADFSSGGPGQGTGASDSGAAGAGGLGGAGQGGGAGTQTDGGGAGGSYGGSAGSSATLCPSVPAACSALGASAQVQAFGCCLGSVRFWCVDGDPALKSEDCAQVSLACAYDPAGQAMGCVAGAGGSAGSGGAPNECAQGACSSSCLDCDADTVNQCETNVQTDPSHCGACGHSCLGGQCLGGSCQVVVMAASQSKPWGVAADSDSVFWTLEGTGSSGSVVSMPIAGTSSKEIATSQAGPVAVRVDDTHVFWTTFSGGESFVRKALKDGTGVENLASGSAAWSLALDASDVFWTNLGGSVRKVPKVGGSPLSQDGESMPWDVALDTTDVYWTTREGGAIRKAPKSLSPASTVLSNLKFPLGLCTAADRLYWVEARSYTSAGCSEANGAVFAADKDGTKLVTIAENQACPTRIAVIDDDVYWTNAGTTSGGKYKYDGSVMRAKSDGSGLKALAVGQVKPHGVVAVGAHVFWTTQGAASGQGAVMRIAR